MEWLMAVDHNHQPSAISHGVECSSRLTPRLFSSTAANDGWDFPAADGSELSH
jgi:hypothetical protein